MTDDTIHTCSYECERPGCIRAQRDELAAKVEALRVERDVLARENEAMKRCAIKYLGWLGVTHMPLDEALREDMSDPTMCGDAAIAAANGGEMADLIERLRAFEGSDELGNGDFSLLTEAATEIEKLRAEVERSERYAEQSERERLWAEERAERLAEALALLPDEIVMVEHNPYEGPLMFCCGQRVTLSWHHGLEPTHGKECWYARMRALRDHDQENKA